MKAILIDPVAKTVTEVENDGTLKDWYKLLDCDTVEVATYLNEQNDSILVDENGFAAISLDSKFFSVKGGHQPFAGRGLVVGVDDNGETISPTITVEEVKALVSFQNYWDMKKMVADME
jgi:hypothetical protein